MDRDYAIFETLPDGGVFLHACVHELTLLANLELLAKESRNAVLRISASARDIVARVNANRADMAMLRIPSNSFVLRGGCGYE